MTTPGQPNPLTPAPTPTPAGAPPAPTPPTPAATTPPAPKPAAPTAAPAPPTPPAPPSPPAPPKAPKPSGGSAAAGAYLLAVVALIIAVAAGAAAAYAVKTAWDVRDATAEATPQDTTAVPTGTATATTPAPTATSTTATPAPTTPTPTGPDFIADFVQVQVNVPAPAANSCNSAYVDVDTLAVGDAAAAGHEFYLTTCGSPLRIFVDRTSGRAISTATDPTPAICHERVTGTPTSELQIPAETGLTFCLLTNQAQATSQSLPQRLAIVSVESITATQVRLVVSTYRVDDEPRP